jgi:Zn-dependent protease
MKWSIRVARLAGVDVYVHLTFLILLAWIAISGYAVAQDAVAVARELGFVLLLFGIVVLHELGHALAARRYGIATRDITLLPIGGVARLERIPDEPRQELVVALAGPAVNVVLAAALYGWLALRGDSPFPDPETMVLGGSLLRRLLWVNVLLVVFNMLPAFPMDGGRVLRSLLAMRMDYARATQIASGVGQAMALLMGFAGLMWGNPLLMFVALFVWIGAAQEAAIAQMKSALAGIPVSRAMITDFQSLSPRDDLARAVEHVLGGFQVDFPVLDDGRVVGVLTRENLLAQLAQGTDRQHVGDAMQQDLETAHPREMLERALARLQTCDCRCLPVMDGANLVGLLTADNVGELMMIQSALRSRRQRRPAAEPAAAAASGRW